MSYETIMVRENEPKQELVGNLVLVAEYDKDGNVTSAAWHPFLVSDEYAEALATDAPEHAWLHVVPVKVAVPSAADCKKALQFIDGSELELESEPAIVDLRASSCN